MGEEQKVEEKKEESPKEEESPPPEIVLKVDMHCEACARKVARSLKKFEGVEEVKADSRAKMVVVKAKTTDLDPMKICERVQKKTHKKVELISPLPKPADEEEKKEEPPKEEEAPPPAEEKKEEPKTITVVLRIRLHCESCAQVLQKRIKKMEGVESVETDLGNDQIIVKGMNIDPNVLVENVYKKTKRQAIIQEEKKEEEKKEEKKEEEEKKELLHEEEEEIKKYEYWPSLYNNNHIQYDFPAYNAYNPYQTPVVQYGSYGPIPAKPMVHYGSYEPSLVKPVVQYGSYVPSLADDQAFSDENPNACSVM
ncbi:hypothetical protein LUZ60_005612 [Juncus effusus]|nr:hypothetical protein LUZ60_005612 [Juncus effusus]